MATTTTTTSSAGWSPDVVAFAPADVIPDALILQTSVVSGSIEGDEPAVRCIYVDDDAAEFVAEGAEIPESDPGLNEVTVFTGKVAQLVKVSREQYQQGTTSGLVSESVRRAVMKRANLAYLAQDAPTSPAVTPPAGILNVPGIKTGGVITTDLDPLSDAVGDIEAVGGTATHIIAAPDAWAALRKLKTSTGHNTTLLGAGTLDAERKLLGLPVLTTPAMDSGTLLVLDRTAIVSAVGDVQVQASEHAYFSSDSIALRCTFRLGQNLVRPDRLVTLTIETE